MKQIVCREDITAELDILCKLHTDVDILKSQVKTLKDRVEFLETKNMRDVSISTPITSTRIWPEVHNYWWEAIPDRIQSDWHWDINDDWTITFVNN